MSLRIPFRFLILALGSAVLASGCASALEVPIETPLKSKLDVISAQAAEGRIRLRALSGNGSPGKEFTPAISTLEDYYFSLVGASSAASKEAD